MNAITESRISHVFAEALQAERESLNARFAEHRVAGHQVDANAFLDHLATTVDPLVCRIAETLPERVRTVVTELYSTSLELFSASLLGPGAKVTEIADVWQRLLPAAAQLVARDPARVVGCLCNAVYNIASQPKTRSREWIDRMMGIAPKCKDTALLLECGRVLAWQAGMVQYRSAALETARRLRAELAAPLLKLPRDTPADILSNVLDRLVSNPWLTPEAAMSSGGDSPSVRIVRKLGAFRGFGGLFLEPPRVSCVNHHLFVSDGHAHWELLADAYGELLQRTATMKTSSDPSKASPKIHVSGKVEWDSRSATFSELASASSSVCDGTTLAVTLPTSHHVYLLALV
jgi:hypothetical protein